MKFTGPFRTISWEQGMMRIDVADVLLPGGEPALFVRLTGDMREIGFTIPTKR